MPGGKSNPLSEPGVDPSVGFGELRPLELGGGPAPASCSPADRWKRESLLTTRAEVGVRTPTGPPYGHTGKMWVVPRSVDTATHLLSGENATSCTEPGVSPLYRVYRWCTAAKADPRGWAATLNRWKL